MSFLSSLSSTVYLSIIVALFALVVTFGGISYYLNASLSETQGELTVAKTANSTLEKSLEKKEQSCMVDNTVVADFQVQNNSALQAKDKELDSIDKLVVVKPVSIPVSASEAPKNEVVDIDGSLPTSLRSVLDSTFERVQGRTDSNAR